MNLAHALDLHARARPHHPAVIEGESQISHAQFADMVRRRSGQLMASGIERGDLVGLCLNDTVDHLVMLYSLARRGAVTLPMDVRWTLGEKERVAGHFGAKCVVLEEGTEPVGPIPSMTMRQLAQQAATADDEAMVDGEGLPLLLSLSSGTTGRPKGPRITHDQMLRRFWTHWINLGLSSADRYISATPLYFGGGRSFAMSVIFSGGTVILYPPPFDVSDFCGEVARTAPSAAFLVPTQLRKLLDLPSATTGPLRNLDLLMSSGAPLEAFERQAIREGLCANFVEYYGSTEGGGISYSAPETQKRYPDSVGWPVFAVDVEVVDEEDGALAAGEIGRLRYRGPGVADGFYRDEEASREAFRDGWFYPGDLAEISEDGFIFLRGRAKDMIIRGGVNIHPGEIEAVLRNHPSVQEAAIVGRPSPVLGEEVAAFVVLRETVGPDVLTTWCRDRLAPYKVPKDITVVEDLPRNSAGKVLKAQLVERFNA